MLKVYKKFPFTIVPKLHVQESEETPSNPGSAGT